MRTDRAIEIVTRLYDEGHINNREQGTLRRAILLPERPEGKWEKPFKMNDKSYHKCTNCHVSSELILIDKYCPFCGAKMSAAEDIKFGGF